jgi:uncharacterized Zn finger protein (UPF0148 family)
VLRHINRLSGRFCSACHVFRHHHPGEAVCSGCERVMAVKVANPSPSRGIVDARSVRGTFP